MWPRDSYAVVSHACQSCFCFFMSLTCTVLMQDDKRGDSSRKAIKLPPIAPKDDYSSSASSSRSGRVSGPAVPPRARLPPRSRTGCWTCRTRKVKCDEGRPVCGQCSRLGHTCDYSPRLSFRDDTPRVVERMQDVTVSGSTVWDSQFPWSPRRRQSADASIVVASPTPSSTGSAIADDLPPFASLMTDEERERKAEASSPGTYQVVVNPDSFQHLPEYSEASDIKRERLSPLRRTSVAASLASSLGRESTTEGVPVPGDPNTVVLPRFEDLSRKTTRELKSPLSPVAQHIQVKLEEPEAPRVVKNEEDVTSLSHFRKVIWRQLAPTEPDDTSSVVVLDKIAAEFPPLLYAIRAVTSQAMSQRDGKELLEGLQHYDQALPELRSHLKNLKSEEDLASDGVFLTHFLMLVYEIATADLEHSQIRTHHLHMLLKIALQRRATFSSEPFSFIVWWICKIDLDSIFSGIGGGEFVSSMLESDLAPPPGYHLFPLEPEGMSVIYPEERETLPILLQLDFEVTRLAMRLGMLAREFRQNQTIRTMNPRQRDMTVRHWQGRVYEYQEALRRLWMASPVLASLQHSLPLRSQRVYEQVFTLYRACIIYSYTSMWPAQRMDTSADFDEELASAASDIVQVAVSLLNNNKTECRFLIFPLFMAGFASLDGAQKMMAMDIIQRMEHDSLGRNTLAVRRALGIVYEKQTEGFMSHGHSLDVDWLDIMVEQGLTVVNFGF